MKVCTDACIFGAYISSEEKEATDDETNILDIGTGTGLLSLMTAQKVKGNIDAVEIDEQAVEQALENFRNSVWKLRLSVFHADITKLKLSKKYNVIISNPPFFEGSLKSSNNQNNLAKHTTSLSYQLLVSLVCSHLTDEGRFYILLPYKEFDVFKKLAAENQLPLMKKIKIRSAASSNYFRTMGVFTNRAVKKTAEELLTIKDNDGEYTNDFIQLLKDYYLYL